MKRILAGLLPLILLLAVPTAALAQTYYQTFTITNSGTTDYTQVPLKISIDNTALVNNLYISSSGLDTRVASSGITLPHMLTDNALYSVLPNINHGVSTSIHYTMGNEPLTSFAIIPGYGGNVTVADSPSLEPGDAPYSLEWSGYVNTTNVGASIVSKPGAFILNVSSPGTITYSANNATVSVSGITSGEQVITAGTTESLQGFQHRKQFTVIAHEDDSHCRIRFTIHKGNGTDFSTDIYLGGLCRDDFNDIAFTRVGNDTFLPHYTQSYVSGDYAYVWCDIGSVSASSSYDVYIYYHHEYQLYAGTSNFSATFPSSYVLTGADTKSGNIAYDWFEIKSGATLSTASNAALNITADVIIIAGTINASGKSTSTTGGGAGGTYCYMSGYYYTFGGGGGGYGGAGGNGGWTQCGSPGMAGGTSYGSQDEAALTLGSMGGTGYAGRAGGNGGGCIGLNSPYVTVTGTVNANGASGTNSDGGGNAGGGGGSGGGVVVHGGIVQVTGSITANGGAGGYGTASGSDRGNGGGGGGGGRIRIWYNNLNTTGSTIQANGGAGGAGGSGAAAGQNGALGTTYQTSPGCGTPSLGSYQSPQSGNWLGQMYLNGLVLTVGSTTNHIEYPITGMVDNGNAWTFQNSTVSPYVNYVKVSINGTQKLWLQPNSIISGNTLPDRSGNNNNGTINFGTNPVDIDITIGSLSPYRTSTISEEKQDEIVFTPLTNPPTTPSGWIRDENTTQYNVIPGSEVINELAAAGGIPLKLVWVPLIFILAIFVQFVLYAKTKHLLASAIAAGILLIFFAAIGMLDWWVLFIYAVIAAGLCVSEQVYGW